MKDQYYGDINDYRKYGLLRAIVRSCGIRLFVAWMLTPDDGSADGKFTAYLKETGKVAWHDPALFERIREHLASGQKRQVSMIESTHLLPEARYFSSLVPDDLSGRRAWFAMLNQRAQGTHLVFLDPDNGLEVKSTAYGEKGSSKYLYWREVEALWASGKSLMIYQHFPREDRPSFIQRMVKAMKKATPDSLVETFSTPYVVFFLVLQPELHQFHEEIVFRIRENWDGQIHAGK